jgi:hypothetical protein
MSRSYLGNTTGGNSSHRNREAQPLWTTPGRGGRVIPPTRTEAPRFLSSRNDIPEWHGDPPQTRSGQWQYHQNRNQNPYGGGYTNPPPPLYYTEGYQGPNTYQQEGRFVPPPYRQYTMGWGGPNPPQEDCIPNEAMDVDDTPTSNPRRMAPLPGGEAPTTRDHGGNTTIIRPRPIPKVEVAPPPRERTRPRLKLPTTRKLGSKQTSSLNFWIN